MGFDFGEMFDLKKEQVVGLDIGSSLVKMVQLEKSGQGYEVTAASVAEIGLTSHEDHRSASAKITSAIHACIGSSNIKAKNFVCSVCGPEVAVRTFNFPTLPKEEVPQAVLLEADQVCPFDASKNIIDYQLLSEGRSESDSMSGVLVAATNEVVNHKIHAVKEAGINCVYMDVDGLALANCLLESQKAIGQIVAILNVGHTFTNLVILRDKCLPFVRDLSHGANGIIEHISSNLSVPRSTVLKVLSGQGDSREEEIRNAFISVSQSLIDDVNQTLRYYLIEQRLSTMDRIYICGGLALAKGFTDLVGAKLAFPVVKWNPFDVIGCKEPSARNILEKSGPAFAVATGLAMRSL